jgi:arylsulfatase A-like enzyme
MNTGCPAEFDLQTNFHANAEISLSRRLELFGPPHCLLVMNKMFRGQFWRKLGWTAAAISAGFSSLAQTNSNHLSITNPPPAPRRPSIILILADNIGYGDLGCYGQKKIKTPNLDKLASEGIRFTSYYVGSPNDEASRASLFTGLEPRHIGASFSRPLPSDAETVAMLLQRVGYHNGLIGQWNLGDTPPVQPNAMGFNEFAGFLSQTHARDYFTDSIYRQDTSTGSNRVESLPQNWNGARGLYVPDLLGQAAGNFIRINQPTRVNHYRAFFLCLSYPIPYDGTPPDDSTYSAESWPQPEKDRATIITRMDENIGGVMAELSRLKAETNTVVIFMSIGGPQKEGATDPKFFESAGRLRGGAGSVYEGGIRVPMIARWPGRIKPGQVSDFVWAAWDLLPTLADIALTKPTAKTDGISVVPVLTGKGKVRSHESFGWESGQDGSDQAVRMGDWKIIRSGTNAPALYNLKTDIGEKDDVAAKHLEVVKKIEKALK